MANTAQAMARADRSIPSRQSRLWRWAGLGSVRGAVCVPLRLAFKRRTITARKPARAAAVVAPDFSLA
jgi:hypothetical protein